MADLTDRRTRLIKAVRKLRRTLRRDPTWAEIYEDVFRKPPMPRTAAAALVLNAWGGSRRAAEFRAATGVRGRPSGGAGHVRNIPTKE